VLKAAKIAATLAAEAAGGDAMMDRRAFFGILGLLAAPIVARAQQPARLGVLLAGSPSGPTPALDALLRRLAELGWVEGPEPRRRAALGRGCGATV
jgi:hypothetical protein